MSDKLKELHDEAWRDYEDDEAVIKHLIRMKVLALKVSTYSKLIIESVDRFLEAIKRSAGNGANMRIAKLGLKLKGVVDVVEKPIAQRIIAEVPALKDYAQAIENEKILRIQLPELLAGVEEEGKPVNAAEIINHYMLFKDEYWRVVRAGLLKPREMLEFLPQRAADIATNSARSISIREVTSAS